MIRRKYDSANCADGATTKVVSLSGIAGKTRTVKRVVMEMADLLTYQVWKNNEKISEGNTAHNVITYGTAAIYQSVVELDEPLKEGDTLELHYANATGGAINPAEGEIEYLE